VLRFATFESITIIITVCLPLYVSLLTYLILQNHTSKLHEICCTC